jgi:hypothetical protein
MEKMDETLYCRCSNWSAIYEKYFKAAGLGPKMTETYIKMLNGKEAV